jgi:hypothetical protein
MLFIIFKKYCLVTGGPYLMQVVAFIPEFRKKFNMSTDPVSAACYLLTGLPALLRPLDRKSKQP